MLKNNFVKTLDNFYGNETQKTKFLNFMKDDKPGSFLILGASGLGKTTLCSLVFSTCNMFVIRPCYEQFSCHKEFVEYIDYMIRISCVTNENSYKVLFLDDIDILVSINRYALSYINQLIKKVKSSHSFFHKIVLTCSVNDEKKMCDLKKKMHYIRLNAPTFDNCKSFINNNISFLSNKHHKLSQIQMNQLEMLIKIMQRNISKIISNLDIIFMFDNNHKVNNKNNEIKSQNKEQSICNEKENSIQVYSNLNIFDLCLNILRYPEKGLLDLIVPLSTDPTLITMIIYDNLSNFFSRFYEINTEKYLFHGFRITDAFVYSSIIESHAFANCAWNNLDWTNLIKCGILRSIQNTFPLKNNSNLSKINFQIKYTTIPTRSSQHYSTLKKLQKYSSSYHLDIDNIMFMNEVLFEKRKKKGLTVSSSFDESSLMNTYMRNICDPCPDVYMKRIIKKYKS